MEPPDLLGLKEDPLPPPKLQDRNSSTYFIIHLMSIYSNLNFTSFLNIV